MINGIRVERWALTNNEIIIIIDGLSLKSGVQAVYTDILFYFYNRTSRIAISQFIDERQSKAENPSFLNNQGNTANLMELKVTNDFYASENWGGRNSTYYVHAYGKPEKPWLERIFRFGGTSLANISYEACKWGSNWKKKLSYNNKFFEDWYRLKTRKSSIFEIMELSDFIIWTSDLQLYVLQEKAHINEFLVFLKNYCAGSYQFEIV